LSQINKKFKAHLNDSNTVEAMVNITYKKNVWQHCKNQSIQNNFNFSAKSPKQKKCPPIKDGHSL
jgi:hypothetical protein